VPYFRRNRDHASCCTFSALLEVADQIECRDNPQCRRVRLDRFDNVFQASAMPGQMLIDLNSGLMLWALE
jgi:hypothetical protein